VDLTICYEMKVPAHQWKEPTKYDHLAAMNGDGVVAYHSMQHGAGFWGSVGHWIKNVGGRALKAGASKFIQGVKKGDVIGGIKEGAHAALDSAAKDTVKEAHKQMRNIRRPF